MAKTTGRVYSGKFIVRLEPEDHQALVELAAARRAAGDTTASLNDEAERAVKRHLLLSMRARRTLARQARRAR